MCLYVLGWHALCQYWQQIYKAPETLSSVFHQGENIYVHVYVKQILIGQDEFNFSQSDALINLCLLFAAILCYLGAGSA